MEKLNRFVAKHVLAVYFAIVALIFALYIIVHPYLGQNQWIAIILVYVGIFLASRWTGTRHIALLKEPMRLWDEQCDPYPFLEEIRGHRNFAGVKILKQLRLINEGSAMMALGDFNNAYYLLLPLQESVGKSKRKDLQTRYYMTVAQLCMAMDRIPEAEIWHEKMMNAYHLIKPETRKKIFVEAMPFYYARYYHSKQEYTQALQMLIGQEPKTLNDRVALAMHYGRNYYALGQWDKAKDPLTFVAEYGNKLYAATQARQMLAEIEAKEEETWRN